MWVRRAAIRPIPAYARVSAAILEQVEQTLIGENEQDDTQLEVAYSRFETTQPALAACISSTLDKHTNETTLALGYFLSLSIWLAFEETFKPKLAILTEQDLDATVQAIALDRELRESAPDEVFETDDVVAMEQPELIEFIREHIDVAIENNDDAVLDEIDEIYKLMLVEAVALSHAVELPAALWRQRTEWQA